MAKALRGNIWVCDTAEAIWTKQQFVRTIILDWNADADVITFTDGTNELMSFKSGDVSVDHYFSVIPVNAWIEKLTISALGTSCKVRIIVG